MTDITDNIKRLHTVYEQVSGLPVQLSLNRMWAWEAWIAKGWTETDLRLVMAHLKRRSSAAPVWAKMNMMFTKFIADPQTFEELLAEARAIARVPRVDPGKAQALRATGRNATAPTSEPRTPDQIMRENKALQGLIDLKNSL